MAKFESYQVPTMIKLRRLTYAHADEVVRDPLLKYIPAAIRKNWEDPRLQEAKLSLDALDALDREYVQSSHIVDRMQRFNVPIMAGTDTGEPYTFPGYDLHRELQLLVKAGLTPLQALRAATITPAEFLEAADSLGTVAPGKMADLVLLDADPLQDIRNTERIAAVVLGGRYLPKSKLDAMLPHARQ
jgi:imidazolonepropionase-like amidohydrolase